MSEAESHNLRVLVWGPSTKNPSDDQVKFAEKRKQIKEALVAEGHEAYFSEDLVPKESSIPVNLHEAIQARESDAVVIVASSHGAIGEVHEIGPLLGQKLLLWLPKAARKGFTDEGIRRYIDAAGGRSVFFGSEDLSACSLALASVDFANDKRYLQAGIAARIEDLKQVAPIKREKL